MRIKVPSPEVVSKIGAGEVVETASSAVTKLVENSINAGATEGSVGISHICVEHLGVSLPDLSSVQCFTTETSFSGAVTETVSCYLRQKPSNITYPDRSGIDAVATTKVPRL